MIKKIYILFFIFITVLPVKSQEYTDSLITEFWKKVENNTIDWEYNRDAYNIGEFLAQQDIQKAIEFNTKLQVLAAEIQSRDLEQTIYMNYSKMFLNQGIYDKALEYLLKGADYIRKYDRGGYAWAISMAGNIYFDKQMFKKAIEYYEESKKQFQMIFQKKELDINDSINFYHGQSVAMNNIALCEIELGNYDKALDLFERGISYRLAVKEMLGYAYQYYYIAYVHILNEDCQKAIPKLKIAEKVIDSLIQNSDKNYYTNNKALARVYTSYADCAVQSGSYDKAIEYFFKAIELHKSIGNNSYKLYVYLKLATYEMEQKNYNNALKYAKIILEKATKYHFYEMKVNAYKLIAEIYYNLGNYKLSSDHFQNSLDIKDSLELMKEQQALELIESNIEAQNQAEEIEELQQERNINDLRLKKQTNFIILLALVILLLLITALIITRNYYDKQRTNKILEEKNDELNLANKLLSDSREELRTNNEKLQDSEIELKELVATKDKFFNIIAHDLKNPIGTFRNSMELLSNLFHTMSDKDKKEFIDELYYSSTNLFALLENLLTWSRSQNGKIQFNPDYINLKAVFDNAISPLKHTAKEKGILIVNNVSEDINLVADANMLFTVFRNLVSNGLKFTEEGGSVTFNLIDENEDYISVSVDDTGVGIPENKLDYLFRIDNTYSTTGTNNEKGTGLGLIICYEFVKTHEGNIRAESEIGKGTSFIITLSKKLTANYS